jgi:hypothetical protein
MKPSMVVARSHTAAKMNGKAIRNPLVASGLIG